MIPRNYIIEWSQIVPWGEPRQIEQDLIITRVLIEIYSEPLLQEALAFWGGTALNKLLFNSSSRYSEDIDFVQILSEKIGPTIDLIQKVLDPWLGKPKKRDFSAICSVLHYSTISEDGFPIKIKIEINTREHFCVMGFQKHPFISNSSWTSGDALITTYTPEELLGTKMRALYQRRKGRDLYDLYIALTTLPHLNTDIIVHCFKEYTKQQHQSISKMHFLSNIEKKLLNKEFIEDIIPLLPRQKIFDVQSAYHIIKDQLIEKI